MPYDIIMCPAQVCTLKANCLRFTGAIYGRQDFFGKEPFNVETSTCEHYLDDRPKAEEVEKEAYKLWEAAGYPENRSLEFWLHAELSLLERRRQ